MYNDANNLTFSTPPTPLPAFFNLISCHTVWVGVIGNSIFGPPRHDECVRSILVFHSDLDFLPTNGQSHMLFPFLVESPGQMSGHSKRVCYSGRKIFLVFCCDLLQWVIHSVGTYYII